MKTRIFNDAVIGAALFVLSDLTPCWGQGMLGPEFKPGYDLTLLDATGASVPGALDGSVAPWLTEDVGAVGVPGNADLSAGVFRVSGSGSDIWRSSDQFRFVYLPLVGDGTIVARIVSVGNTDPAARAGVMFRQSLDSGSVNAAVIVTAGIGTGLTYRNVPNGTTFIQGDSGKAPYWVKMSRTGSKFTGFISSDGANWKQVAQPDIAMDETVLVGLCVTAHDNTVLNTSVFDNVTVTGVTNVPPSTLPPPWVNNDVGAVGLTGSAGYDSGNFTVSGSGADIWGSADAFQFVWQPLLGDGAIIARVVSVGNSDPAARGGVMFRQSLAPGSVNAAVIVTASKGTGLTYRNQPNGTTFIQGDAGQAPYWIRMDRIGRKFTGYISSDGANWKQIAQPDISMSDPVLVGLCVTAHNSNALNTTVFDNVMVIQTESWISPVSGEWHVASSWSLGIRPDISQTAVFVTNSGQKVVTINSTTRDYYPESLSINRLTVAGTPNSTNTLNIDRIGATVPFQVFHDCNVGTNGEILNRDSVFHVKGGGSVFWNVGRTTQSGGSNVFDYLCAVADSGTYDLIDGTTLANSLEMEGRPGGTYNQYNGATIANEIRVSSYPTGGVFNLFNGAVTAGLLGILEGGTFCQNNGSVTATNLYLFAGNYYLSNGDLVTKSFTSALYGNATFTQLGGTHRADWVSVPSRFERWFGVYLLKGGVFASQESYVNNPGGLQQSGGSNLVDKLTVTGDYELTGGVLQSSNVVVGPQVDFYLGAILHQTGGTFTSGSIVLNGSGAADSSSVLSHAGGSLTNIGDFVFQGGQLNPNNATGHLGSLVLKGDLRSYIVCSNGPFVERFSSSAEKVWDSGANTFLVIVDWKGSSTGGGAQQIYAGNSAAGLTATQLGQIRFLFNGQLSEARILDTGELVPGALVVGTEPRAMAVTRSGGSIILDWPTNRTLQTATNVNGPYYDLIGVFGPLTNHFTDEHRFFRLKP